MSVPQSHNRDATDLARNLDIEEIRIKRFRSAERNTLMSTTTGASMMQDTDLPYTHTAQYYDLDWITDLFDDDVPFYLDYAARSSGTVLDLACGTGRVSIPLAMRGYTVAPLTCQLRCSTNFAASSEPGRPSSRSGSRTLMATCRISHLVAGSI